jgi:hypothetical protein
MKDSKRDNNFNRIFSIKSQKNKYKQCKAENEVNNINEKFSKLDTRISRNLIIVFSISILIIFPSVQIFGISQITIVESAGQTQSPFVINDENGENVFVIFSNGVSIINKFIKISGTNLTELRDYSFPNSDGVIVLENSLQSISNKTINSDSNVISNIDNDEIRDNAQIDWSKISKVGSSLHDLEDITPITCTQNQILKFSGSVWICGDEGAVGATGPTGATGSGETNTASNTIADSATQKGLSKTKSGVDLPFKVIASGTNIGISTDSNQVTLDALNKINTVSINTTLDSTYGTVLVDASGGNVTITLPNAVGISGKIFSIKKIDSTANIVTVATTSSQTIDGKNTSLLGIQNNVLMIQSNDLDWIVISNYNRLPFAQISDSTDQSVAASGAISDITLNQNDLLVGILHSTTVNNHQITIVEPGIYQISAIAQIGRSSAITAGTHNIWILKNGVNIENSNIKTYMPATLAATNIGVINNILSLDAGDIISFQQSCSDTTNIKLKFTSSGSSPSTPSIKVTIAKISD